METLKRQQQKVVKRSLCMCHLPSQHSLVKIYCSNLHFLSCV